MIECLNARRSTFPKKPKAKKSIYKLRIIKDLINKFFSGKHCNFIFVKELYKFWNVKTFQSYSKQIIIKLVSSQPSIDG